LWVTDFGLAAIQGCDGPTMTGDVLGTLRYMSPEQASARRGVVDHRTDVYSLGITLYEMLTLEPAHGGRDRQEMLTRLACEEPRPCRKLNPAIPRDLETIVLKAIAKDVSDRYPTAHALANDLRRFLATEPIAARRPGLASQVGRWTRRHRAWVTAACVVAGLALVGLSMSTALIWRALLAEEQQRALAESRDRDSRRHLYAAHMHLALEDWQRGNVERVLELLGRHQPQPGQEDLRGFEWHHLWRLCHHALADELRGGIGPLDALAVSERAGLVAAAGKRGRVRVWDLATHELRFEIPATGGAVESLALTPDGLRLAVGRADGTATLWNTKDGSSPLELARSGLPVLSAAFTPDGSWLVTGSGDVRVWDAQTGELRAILKGLANAVNCVAVSPDGRTIAGAGNSRTVVTWQLDSLEQQLSSEPGVKLGEHGSYIRCLAFSPDSATLLSGGEDGVVNLWDVAAKQLRTTIHRHTGAVSSAAFAPRGEKIATVSWDGSVKVWSSGEGSVLLQQGHRGRVCAAVFAADGKTLLTSGEDGSIRSWDMTTEKEPLVRDGHLGKVRALSFAAGGDRLISGATDGLIQQWDLTGKQPPLAIEQHADWVMGIVLTPGEGQLISADVQGNVLMHARERDPVPLEPAGGPVWSLAIAPDGRTLAAAGYVSNNVILWDVPTRKKRITLTGHTDRVWTVAFAPDGQTLASAANDRTVRLWDVRTGQQLASLPVGVDFIYCLAFAPGGRTIALGGEDRRIHRWDMNSRRELPPLGVHPTTLRCLAYFPDGKSLAVGGDDGTVKLWDLATGEERLALVPPARLPSSVANAPIWALAISQDGRRLAIGDADGRVIVWRGR
jgi:WD40 repeat protein